MTFKHLLASIRVKVNPWCNIWGEQVFKKQSKLIWLFQTQENYNIKVYLPICSQTLFIYQHSPCPLLEVVPSRQDKVNFNSTPICFDGTPKAKGLSSTDALQQQEQSCFFKKFVFNNRKYFPSLISTLKPIIYYIYHANSKVHASFSQHFCSQNVQSIC